MKYRKRRPVRIRLEQLWKWLIAVLLLGGAIRGCESMNDLVAVYGENQCRNLVVTSTMEKNETENRSTVKGVLCFKWPQ